MNSTVVALDPKTKSPTLFNILGQDINQHASLDSLVFLVRKLGFETKEIIKFIL